MIVSFRDKRTADFAAGTRFKACSGIERPARLKPDRLEAAHILGDLAALPGNRFEALKGDRKGQYSIRVNDQWRVCFEWPQGSPGPANVEIVDYHEEGGVIANATDCHSSRRTCGRGTRGTPDERRGIGPPFEGSYESNHPDSEW